jgi:hypothetical protein
MLKDSATGGLGSDETAAVDLEHVAGIETTGTPRAALTGLGLPGGALLEDRRFHAVGAHITVDPSGQLFHCEIVIVPVHLFFLLPLQQTYRPPKRIR